MYGKTDDYLGVGVNYRKSIESDILQYISDIDFVEVNTERFFYEQLSPDLKSIMKNVPITLHGLALSLGDSNDIKEEYINNLKKTLYNIDHAWYSDHIALTREKNIELRSLMPVAFTEENVGRIVDKVIKIKSISKTPFILENITYYFSMPGSYLSEGKFITSIVEQSDCGLLLDVNNLFINAYNHGYDPYKFLHEIPLERVVEIHLAGGELIENMMVDTHASSIKKDVIKLFKNICKITSFNGVIIERDAKLDRFSDLVNEVVYIKELVRKHRSIYQI